MKATEPRGDWKRAMPASRFRLTRIGVAIQESFVLPPATMNLEVVIASGPAAIDAIHLVTDLVATLLPAMQRVGVATPSEVELPTLSHRIAAEQSGPTLP